VRDHGTLNDLPEAGTTDHLCWVYDDDALFDRAVEAFLSGGLERGERLLCVGERVIESLRASHRLAEKVAALMAAGALQTQTLAQAYEAAGPFLAENQRTYYETATRRALAEGYRGLRVIAEVSVLAADPVTRSELVRWEHVADGLIAQNVGFTAMCAYNGELADEALADIASVHPVVHTPDAVPAFQLFFDDGRIVLAGSVDTFGADRLSRALAASPVGPEGAVLDLGPLEFVDVAGCRAVVLWARGLEARSVPVEIRGASPLFRRMSEILAAGEVAVDDSDEAA
jgi:hypothetical protein